MGIRQKTVVHLLSMNVYCQRWGRMSFEFVFKDFRIILLFWLQRLYVLAPGQNSEVHPNFKISESFQASGDAEYSISNQVTND